MKMNANIGIGTTSPGYKLEVNGTAHVTGVFTAGTKTFLIDHPLAPETKSLQHGCLEGPEHGVYYRGQAKLINGEAVIELPDYFEALTRKQGRTVQLSPKGSEPYLLSATDVLDGKFIVYGTKPDGKFYWEVKAIRADVEPLRVERPKGEQSG